MAGHKVIKGVCLCAATDDEDYLLLMQVSSSPYNEHKTKCLDIGSSFQGTTLAEYYRSLAHVDQDHVIYLYISMEEYDGDLVEYFSLTPYHLRSGVVSPVNQYLYGVLADFGVVNMLNQH